MKTFIIVVLLYSIKSLDGIIRNDITDRCLYLGSALDIQTSQTQLDKRKLLVYARSCKWRAEDNKGHSNQWVEVVPFLKPTYSSESPDFTNMSYFVRKVTQNDSVCLASKNDEPTVSSVCSSPDTTFGIELVHQKNFKGRIPSITTFKLKNDAGYCLTVQPGHETLKFTECSSRNSLFQVWSICRHTGRCDVGLTWSPKQIDFPSVPLNKNPVTQSPLEHKIDTISQITSSHVHGIINEVLYTVQNALRIYDDSDNFIIGTLNSFYPREIIVEAANELKNICKDTNMQCSPCQNIVKEHNIANNLTGWLILWMKQCNHSPISKLFLSSDILNVPIHLFPMHDSSQSRNSNNIPDADANKLSFDLNHKHAEQIGKRLVEVSISKNNMSRNDNQTSTTLNPVYDDNYAKIILPQEDAMMGLNDTLPLIDIRFLKRPAAATTIHTNETTKINGAA